ncbi:Auxin-responsive GH3 family protein [Striga hermonthica]|uniref:Auxin-responsive GH3 family protein n=1 Tax=Striga hermonthica TaxID=68872 RepID=A0A9N7MMA2_STRHE|nr:Auxin-responsive GH3 family protein [Striga hermonthica]
MTTFPSGGECGDIIDWFDDVAERAGTVQTETLRTILEANHRVEYLKKWLKDVNVNEMESRLYRYRLGDVVQVSGFYRNTPKLSFVCRRKLILTVNIDKNTEKDLQSVVEKGSQILHKTKKAELIDFTSHASVAHQPGHYVIYWEIKGEADGQLLSECCTEMDASFVDPGYVVSRKSSSIGPLELRIVEEGTFEKIVEHFIGIGAGLNQFKTPRCTTNPVLLKILDACTVKKIRSTAYGSS